MGNSTTSKQNFNSIFKSVYGNFLGPKGFKLLKSKYPHFIRIIDDEIIQTISITKEKVLLNKDFERLSLCVGVGLMSLQLTEFDENPLTIGNHYIIDLRSLYHKYSLNFDVDKYAIRQFSFAYKKGDNAEILNAMNESQQKLMPFVLDFFEMTKTLEDIYKLTYSVLRGLQRDVAVLTQKADELLDYREKVFPEERKTFLTVMDEYVKNNPFMRPLAERKKAEAIQIENNANKWLADRKVGGAEYESYMKQANETKNENMKEIYEKRGFVDYTKISIR